eukprot:137763_1
MLLVADYTLLVGALNPELFNTIESIAIDGVIQSQSWVPFGDTLLYATHGARSVVCAGTYIKVIAGRTDFSNSGCIPEVQDIDTISESVRSGGSLVGGGAEYPVVIIVNNIVYMFGGYNYQMVAGGYFNLW